MKVYAKVNFIFSSDGLWWLSIQLSNRHCFASYVFIRLLTFSYLLLVNTASRTFCVGLIPYLTSHGSHPLVECLVLGNDTVVLSSN